MPNVKDWAKANKTDIVIPFTFTDSDGAAKDITGWTIRMTIKENPGDTDANAKLQKDANITNAEDGAAQIEIADTDTTDLEGVYYYDIKYKDDSGDIFSIISGKFLFKQSITISMD